MPKYLLLVNHDNGAIETSMSEWAPDEIAAHLSYYEALSRELIESGEQVGFTALVDPRLARIVRCDGASPPVVTVSS